MTLGEPREHHETIGSTNARARKLADKGASHGTLVTADEQTKGRGRQGRTWVTPPGVPSSTAPSPCATPGQSRPVEPFASPR